MGNVSFVKKRRAKCQVKTHVQTFKQECVCLGS